MGAGVWWRYNRTYRRRSGQLGGRRRRLRGSRGLKRMAEQRRDDIIAPGKIGRLPRPPSRERRRSDRWHDPAPSLRVALLRSRRLSIWCAQRVARAASRPPLDGATFAAWRWLQKARLAANTRRATWRVQPDRYLVVSRVLPLAPSTVKGSVSIDRWYRPEQGCGHVADGDWDRRSCATEKHPCYKVTEEVISRGIPWRDAESCKKARSVIRAGGTWRGRSTIQEFEERCQHFDELLGSMRDSGCLTVTGNQQRRPIGFQAHKVDEINMAIGRDGHFFLVDGHHRFLYRTHPWHPSGLRASRRAPP